MSEVQKFRKKPVVIEAMQFNGDEGDDIYEWASRHDPDVDMSGSRAFGIWSLFIGTLEGVMTASRGDWIIRGVQGEFYPCKPDIFEATYEPVPSSSAPKEPDK